MGNDIHLVYSSDANYLEPVFVSAASAIYFHTAPGTLFVHFYLENVTRERFSEFEKQFARFVGKRDFELVYHVWDPKEFDRFPKWNNSSLIYVRMVLPERLPEADWAIACDGDTLWLSDPAEVWALRDDSLYFHISEDPPPRCGDGVNHSLEWFHQYGLHLPPEQYGCAGFLLLNLHKMRAEKFAQKCIDFLDRYPDPPLCEQMVICYVGRDKLRLLPKKWGVFAGGHDRVDLADGGLIHYVQYLPTRLTKVNRLLTDVVMIWHEFCWRVLKEDHLKPHVNCWNRLWRRWFYVILKTFPWVTHVHHYLWVHLPNTGLSKREWASVMAKFAEVKA